jgi:outer membrane protein assembly factor BamE (lipoprotein component of BamABCDE complex)
MLFNFKNHLSLTLFLSFFILNHCQFQEASKNHGIVFLENRANKLIINTTNKNDVIKIIGNPHSKSISNENQWIYIERILSKGEYHKLGQNILKSNNVLVLEFDKYGILKKRDFYNKDDKKNVEFSSKETSNELTKKSFIENVLSSVKEKMYGRRK